MLRVILDPVEAGFVASAGRRRWQLNTHNGTADPLLIPGQRGSRVDNYRRGAVAEYAASRWLNLSWVPILTRPGHLSDLQDDENTYEIKTTESPGGSLIIKKKNRRDAIYILTFIPAWPPGETPLTVEIIGWLPGVEGKTDTYWSPTMPHPAYSIPQRDLRSPYDLSRRRIRVEMG